jgi:hypothetical protein
MLRRVSRHFSPLLVVIALVWMGGCRDRSQNQPPALYAQVRVPFQRFIKTPLAVRAGHEADGLFLFPEEALFNRSGKLVFLGHGSGTDTLALPEILRLVKRPPEHAPLSLSEGLQGISGLSSDMILLSAGHHPTELSIFLDDCYGCSLQEAYLTREQSCLLESGFNVLVVYVDRGAAGGSLPAGRNLNR